ncbi:hypothetical protein C8J57DRAFT_1220938 [Mycena rebaudengoi]|nr:hypothetical protein C8J57DRAFT_1220938 [Mycena rebaudengoi]
MTDGRVLLSGLMLLSPPLPPQYPGPAVPETQGEPKTMTRNIKVYGHIHLMCNCGSKPFQGAFIVPVMNPALLSNVTTLMLAYAAMTSFLHSHPFWSIHKPPTSHSPFTVNSRFSGQEYELEGGGGGGGAGV